MARNAASAPAVLMRRHVVLDPSGTPGREDGISARNQRYAKLITQRAEPPKAPQTPPEPSHALPAPSRPVNAGLHVLREDELADLEDEAHLWHRIDPY